jgi:ElaB/YqjD/DUF883 family membrane-anchored ribosome-binding protein
VDQLKDAASKIVKRGENVRAEISKLVSDATGKFHATTHGLTDLAKAVADGAAAGVQQVAPSGSESTLRAVADGLADGFTKSAHAAKLAWEESGKKGAQFAKEDLDKIVKDFRSLGDNAVEITGRLARGCGGQLSSQFQTILDHTKTTLQSLRAPLESVVKAAWQNPVGLGKETLHAGASATRQAAGVFFSEIGRHLQSAGDWMRKPEGGDGGSGSGGGNAA